MTLPPIAILAGGMATRMGELVRQIPKSLLDVHGRPFLAWQLELLASAGIEDVVLCVGHRAEQIEDYCARSPVSGVRLRFSHDGARRLGTGGALRHALPMLGDAFLVTYGDSYLRCDFGEVFAEFAGQRELHGARGLMTVFRNEDRFDASNVVFEDGKIMRYDKRDRVPAMRHIDWGLGVLTADAFHEFGEGPFDLAHVYEGLVADGKLAGLEVDQRFYEVGSRSGLEEFRAYIAGVVARGSA